MHHQYPAKVYAASMCPAHTCITILYFRGLSKGIKGIALCYCSLNISGDATKPEHMLAWEKDLGQILSAEHWHLAATWTARTSRNESHWETSIKLIHHWHYTPEALSHIYSFSSRNCWRSCGVNGSHFHIWWACPLLQPYWQWVIQLIAAISRIPTPMDSPLAHSLCYSYYYTSMWSCNISSISVYHVIMHCSTYVGVFIPFLNKNFKINKNIFPAAFGIPFVFIVGT